MLRQDFEICMLEWTFWPISDLLEIDLLDAAADVEVDDDSSLVGPLPVREVEAEDAHTDAHPEADFLSL